MKLHPKCSVTSGKTSHTDVWAFSGRFSLKNTTHRHAILILYKTKDLNTCTSGSFGIYKTHTVTNLPTTVIKILSEKTTAVLCLFELLY